MKMLTAKNVAQKMQLTTDAVYRMSRAGDIPAPIQIGRRLLRWPEESFEKWLAGKYSASQPDVKKSGIVTV